MSLNETLIEIPVLTLPVPNGNIQIFWVLLGMQFGRSFGKKLDQEMQAAGWFTGLPPAVQGFLKRVLDFTHHWWVGGFLWLYPMAVINYLGLPVSWEIPVIFFGVGLLIDDLRDVQNLRRRYGNGD